MLHDNMMSARSCYREIIPNLKKDYFIVIPEIQGLNGNGDQFISVEHTAKHIEEAVLRQYKQGVYGICGLSLGGTLGICLLERGKLKPKKAFIDAAFAVDMGIKATFYTMVFALLSQLLRPIEAFPSLKNVLNKWIPISKMGYFGCTLKNECQICKSVYHYSFSKSIAEVQADILFTYGSREKYPAQTAYELKKYNPHMMIDVKEGMGHVGYLMFHPDVYSTQLINFLKDKESK